MVDSKQLDMTQDSSINVQLSALIFSMSDLSIVFIHGSISKLEFNKNKVLRLYSNNNIVGSFTYNNTYKDGGLIFS